MIQGSTIIAAATDWSLGLMPIWIIWDSHLSRRNKIVVCLLLGLGALASTAPIVRLLYLPAFLQPDDFLWELFGVAIWTLVELGVGIVVISLHALRPLLKRISSFARSLSPGSNKRSTQDEQSRSEENPGLQQGRQHAPAVMLTDIENPSSGHFCTVDPSAQDTSMSDNSEKPIAIRAAGTGHVSITETVVVRPG